MKKFTFLSLAFCCLTASAQQYLYPADSTSRQGTEIVGMRSSVKIKNDELSGAIATLQQQMLEQRAKFGVDQIVEGMQCDKIGQIAADATGQLLACRY